MTPRVLRLYHGGVIGEHRWRDRHLRERYGWDMHLAAPPAFPEGAGVVALEPEPSALPIHVLKIYGRREPNLFWYDPLGLRALLKRLRPDIVDVHEEPFGLAAGAALPLIKRYAPEAKISLYTAQNLPKRYPPPFSWLEQRALTRAAWAYPCSREAGERLRARGFSGGVTVMPLGVTVPESAPEHRGPRRTVGFVGRLEPYKGAHIALAAFAQVSHGRDVSLEIVGSGSQAEALATEAERLGIADRVVFTGALAQDATLARMGDFDILLVPSLETPEWKEQFGRVAVEGMAAGAVVIASDSGALRDVVGEVGVLTPEGDAEAMAGALGDLLDDPARLAARSAQAREAAQRYTWDAVAAQMDEMYRTMAAQPAPALPR